MAKKSSDHKFSNDPPAQEKFSIPGGRQSSPATAKPFTHPDVSTQKGNAMALEDASGCGRYGRPVFDDLSSPHIHPSRTNGKGV